MEHIPEPSGVERTWTTGLWYLILVVILVAAALPTIGHDASSVAVTWLIMGPLVLCMFCSVWRMRKQAHAH